MAPQLEWCVMLANDAVEPHIGPMTEAQARAWLDKYEAKAGKAGIKPGTFYLAFRSVSDWTPVLTRAK